LRKTWGNWPLERVCNHPLMDVLARRMALHFWSLPTGHCAGIYFIREGWESKVLVAKVNRKAPFVHVSMDETCSC
jgi:hypothetical protein